MFRSRWPCLSPAEFWRGDAREEDERHRCRIRTTALGGESEPYIAQAEARCGVEPAVLAHRGLRYMRDDIREEERCRRWSHGTLSGRSRESARIAVKPNEGFYVSAATSGRRRDAAARIRAKREEKPETEFFRRRRLPHVRWRGSTSGECPDRPDRVLSVRSTRAVWRGMSGNVRNARPVP